MFKEIMLKVYREKLTGPVPKFPARMEQSINAYLEGDFPGWRRPAALGHICDQGIRSCAGAIESRKG